MQKGYAKHIVCISHLSQDLQQPQAMASVSSDMVGSSCGTSNIAFDWAMALSHTHKAVCIYSIPVTAATQQKLKEGHSTNPHEPRLASAACNDQMPLGAGEAGPDRVLTQADSPRAASSGMPSMMTGPSLSTCRGRASYPFTIPAAFL